MRYEENQENTFVARADCVRGVRSVRSKRSVRRVRMFTVMKVSLDARKNAARGRRLFKSVNEADYTNVGHGSYDEATKKEVFQCKHRPATRFWKRS